MVMKLYGTGSPNVQRASLAFYLAEVDVEKEVEFVYVSLMNGQHLSPIFKSKQIFGTVPYFEDGDVSIYESRAMAKYIIEKYDGLDSPLLGKTLQERATINTWMESEAQNFHPAVSPVLREIFLSKFVFKRPPNQEIISTGLAKIGKVLDVYEGHLAKNKYLAGEKYSLADAFHTPYMEKVRTVDVFNGILESRPHVAAWVADITSHPAFQKCKEVDWDNAATPLE